MTKGDKYRAYYAANRERIMEANRERAAQRREALREADVETRRVVREEEREKRNKIRSTHYRATFEELSKICGEQWEPVYAALASLPSLAHMTPTMFNFLTTMHRASEVVENNEPPQ